MHRSSYALSPFAALFILLLPGIASGNEIFGWVTWKTDRGCTYYEFSYDSRPDWDWTKVSWSGACDRDGAITGPGVLRLTAEGWWTEWKGNSIRGLLHGPVILRNSNGNAPWKFNYGCVAALAPGDFRHGKCLPASTKQMQNEFSLETSTNKNTSPSSNAPTGQSNQSTPNNATSAKVTNSGSGSIYPPPQSNAAVRSELGRAESNPATHCVTARRNENNAYHIVNNCTFRIEAAWCVIGHDCKYTDWGYSNTYAIPPGGTYPVAGSIGKSVAYAACDKAHVSIKEIKRGEFICD